MKKRYQMDRESAVRGFRKQAEESEQELQLHLPLKEVAAALQEGVGHLMRQAGLELMPLIMDNEVRSTAGERYQRREAGQPCTGAGRAGVETRAAPDLPRDRGASPCDSGRLRFAFRRLGWLRDRTLRQRQTLGNRSDLGVVRLHWRDRGRHPNGDCAGQRRESLPCWSHGIVGFSHREPLATRTCWWWIPCYRRFCYEARPNSNYVAVLNLFGCGRMSDRP